MSIKNCINCAAPFDMSLNKCPYCGTSYYDMSFLDFEFGKPFVLKIKTNMNGKQCYITQMVIAKNDMSIDFSCDTTTAYNTLGNPLVSWRSSNVSFEAVTLPEQKELIRIELEG